MGVQGLWSLIEPVGYPVALESLEGKILAIDVSLWLHQAVRGSAAYKQEVRNPHLVTLFHRIVKLLFYRVKPVFVFDGLELPYFKKRTLDRRKLKRDLASLQLNKIQRKILTELAKKELLPGDDDAGEGTDRIQKLLSNAKSGGTENEKMFSAASAEPVAPLDRSDSENDDESEVPSCSTRDSSFSSETDVDINSEEFQSLPMEIQRELLVEMQEKSREQQKSLTENLPAGSVDFSNFQIHKLLKKGKINQRLDEIHKELTARNTVVSSDWLTQTYGVGAGEISVKKVVFESLKKQHILIEEKEKKDEEIMNRLLRTTETKTNSDRLPVSAERDHSYIT